MTVSKKQANQPLLDCLLPCIPYLDSKQWLSLLGSGHIQVEGQVCCDNVLVLAGQVICYTVPNYSEAEVDTQWTMLWSNHEVAAIHKPANLPVNRTTRNVYNTLIQLLRRESEWPDAHLLHRLDLETSGVLLIAQSNAIARTYQSALSHLIKRKVYHAMVVGEPDWQALEYQCDLSVLPDSAIRSQMHVVADGEGKKASTCFRVLDRRADYSLIECELLTGRKHQIRAQLAHLGIPVVGDKIYSNNGEFYLKRLDKTLTEQDYAELLSPHHLLHAYEIHLHNLWQPDSADIVIQDADYPVAWKNYLR